MPESRTAMTGTDTKLTHDDYLLFPEDGLRHEILDGEHYVTASPRVVHQRISGQLFLLIAGHCRGRELGEVFHAPFDVILSTHNVVEPDLLFVSKERSSIVQDWVRGAPDLVIEILSPSTRRRDETLKTRIYREQGILEYWIVDPEAETVKVWDYSEGGAPEPRLLVGSAELTSPRLPGLTITLAEVFQAPISEA